MVAIAFATSAAVRSWRVTNACGSAVWSMISTASVFAAIVLVGLP